MKTIKLFLAILISAIAITSCTKEDTKSNSNQYQFKDTFDKKHHQQIINQAIDCQNDAARHGGNSHGNGHGNSVVLNPNSVGNITIVSGEQAAGGLYENELVFLSPASNGIADITFTGGDLTTPYVVHVNGVANYDTLTHTYTQFAGSVILFPAGYGALQWNNLTYQYDYTSSSHSPHEGQTYNISDGINSISYFVEQYQ